MLIIFNELSLTEKVEAGVVIQWMEDLINLVNKLKPFAFTNEDIKIRRNNRDDFYQTEVGKLIQEWENDGDWGNEIKLRWWNITDDPQIDESLINEEEYANITQATLPELNNQPCEGLKVAHLTNKTYPREGTLAISFPVDIFAENEIVSLILHYHTEQRNVRVKHISQLLHIESHKMWLIENNNLLRSHRYSIATLFPRLAESLEIIGDLGQFKKEHQVRRNVSILEEKATLIALLNGWFIDGNVSQLNRNRLIFKSFDENMYLSLDYQHAAFEVYDRNGNHLGEREFDGRKKEGKDKQDNTGRHNIRVN